MADQFDNEAWQVRLLREHVLQQCRFALLAASDLVTFGQAASQGLKERGALLAQSMELLTRDERMEDPAQQDAILAESRRLREQANRIDTSEWCLRQDYSMRTLLVSASNVHKTLWGSEKEKHPQRIRRREALRSSLNVTAKSRVMELANDFRNDFEHWDERIEQPFEGGPFRMHLYFYADSLTLELSGRSLDLAALLNEITELQAQAQ